MLSKPKPILFSVVLPIGGLHIPAATGMMPKTILISPYDSPICFACKIKKGYKPNKAINLKSNHARLQTNTLSKCSF